MKRPIRSALRRSLLFAFVALVVASLLGVLPSALARNTVTNSIPTGGLTGGNTPQVTVVGENLTLLADGSGSLVGRRVLVWSASLGEQPVVLMARVSKAPNGVFVDLQLATTVAELTTAVAAINLATSVPAHPAPDQDAVDTAALAEAAE